MSSGTSVWVLMAHFLSLSTSINLSISPAFCTWLSSSSDLSTRSWVYRASRSSMWSRRTVEAGVGIGNVRRLYGTSSGSNSPSPRAYNRRKNNCITLHSWWRVRSMSKMPTNVLLNITQIIKICNIMKRSFLFTAQDGRWYPIPRSGWVVPNSQIWTEGYPIPGLHGGTPIPGPDRDGVPPLSRTGWGTPLVRRQTSITSTCYAVAGMPLAFTQENFLVYEIILIHFLLSLRLNCKFRTNLYLVREDVLLFTLLRSSLLRPLLLRRRDVLVLLDFLHGVDELLETRGWAHQLVVVQSSLWRKIMSNIIGYVHKMVKESILWFDLLIKLCF